MTVRKTYSVLHSATMLNLLSRKQNDGREMTKDGFIGSIENIRVRHYSDTPASIEFDLVGESLIPGYVKSIEFGRVLREDREDAIKRSTEVVGKWMGVNANQSMLTRDLALPFSRQELAYNFKIAELTKQERKKKKAKKKRKKQVAMSVFNALKF